MSINKSLYDISWGVTEEEYRDDPALSYSTLATYERSGFNGLDKLFDRKETPSLTFGSAVDSIITGGEQEFNSRFIVASLPSDIPDTIVKIVKDLFKEFHITYPKLEDIPATDVLRASSVYNYQTNWKPDTRVKVIKEKGWEYYFLLHLCDNKTLISSELYEKVLASVRALKESDSTKDLFTVNPFDDSIETLYQLKFKATLHNIDYRCMADLIRVDHKNKIVYPFDLKTSGHPEWEFHKSFIDWDYQIQARLYSRIIRDNMNRDSYFKDFALEDYRFIVVNKETLTPLVWWFPMTSYYGTITYGANNQYVLRDPEDIGMELSYYLQNRPSVPNGINIVGDNNLEEWLNL